MNEILRKTTFSCFATLLYTGAEKLFFIENSSLSLRAPKRSFNQKTTTRPSKCFSNFVQKTCDNPMMILDWYKNNDLNLFQGAFLSACSKRLLGFWSSMNGAGSTVGKKLNLSVAPIANDASANVLLQNHRFKLPMECKDDVGDIFNTRYPAWQWRHYAYGPGCIQRSNTVMLRWKKIDEKV